MTLTDPSQPNGVPHSHSASLPRSGIPAQSLTWLWPLRIPFGKITLLDGAPGCGTSLFALTLAACVTSGLPWPDGTPSIQGLVLLIAPHDNYLDTIQPRLHAAGGDPYSSVALDRVFDPADPATGISRSTHPFSLPQDLDELKSMIVQLKIVLVIIDPFSAITGLGRSLQHLIRLAERTHCAMLLTRSLSHAPADLLHPRIPASPIYTAARSHLLLAPDPSDERHCLLLTTKHPLCAPAATLSYTITVTEHDVPTIHWLPERDPSQLSRLSTAPLRSPHRQAILRFLRTSPTPHSIKEILAATSYDYGAGRKMLLRMQRAGELLSLARGLYTTPDHPCLAQFTADSQPVPPTSPVPPVSNVPDIAEESSASIEPGEGKDIWALSASGVGGDPRSVGVSQESGESVPCPNSDLASTIPSQPTIPVSKSSMGPVPNVPDIQTPSTLTSQAT